MDILLYSDTNQIYYILQPKTNLDSRPYIIGLTGGIASGKTNIANFLKTLGAGIINCDAVAHDLYKVGATGYHLIVQQFGSEIQDDDGVIDRKKLGSLVFNDQVGEHSKYKKLINLGFNMFPT